MLIEELEEILRLLLQIITIVICTGLLLRSLRRLRFGHSLVQYLCYIIFYFFFVVPIILQLIFPDYQYQSFWRANEAMADGWCNCLYYFFVVIASIVMIRSSKKDFYTETTVMTVNQLQINTCSIIIIICFASTIFTNGFSIITGGYGIRFMSDAYSVNEIFIGCGIISYLTLIAQISNVGKIRFGFLTILIVLFFWIVGKRYIVAETLVLSVYILAITKQIDGRRLVRYILTGSLLIILSAYLYGVLIKGNVDSLIDYFNVDLSRQYTLVYQFYCRQIGRQISLNGFDAIVYLVLFWVPRSMWPNKPYPFINSLTWSLVSNGGANGTNLGWATTASIFSDLFDAFSYLGLVLGLALLVFVMRKCNRTSKTYIKVLWMYTAVRLMTVQLSSAIVQIVICAFVFCLCDKLGNNKIQAKG